MGAIEKRIYKINRNSMRSNNSEVMYGGNFDRVQNEYYRIYLDYLNNLLLNLISYENAPLTFDSRFAEYCLRMWGYCRIGGTDKDNIFVFDGKNGQLPNTGKFGGLIDDTSLLLPGSIDDKRVKQINRSNFKQIGVPGYVTLSNKYSWYVGGFALGFNDFDLIDRVAKTLALIKATQVFNLNQLKTPYVGYTTNKNLTAKNIWNNINAGIPFIELDESVGDISRVFGIANLNVQDHLQSLKDQFNNELSEFLTIVGINTIGIDKKERLVQNEANANAQLTEASANIYLEARNNQLELLNYRLGSNIKAVLNQDAAKELLSLKNNVDFGEPENMIEKPAEGVENNG